MATTINNAFGIRLAGFTSVTAAASRTFTATRLLRLFDAKVVYTAVVAGVGTTFTASNGADMAVTLASPNPPVQDIMYRLGHDAGGAGTDLIDDDHNAIAAGSTIVFAIDQAARTCTAVLFAYPV